MEKPDFQHPQSQSTKPTFGQVFSDTPDVSVLKGELSALKQKVEQMQNTRINFNTDIIGLFETVSAVPTGIPTSPYEQIKIYVSGGTLRLYWYDSVAHVWHYVTATA